MEDMGSADLLNARTHQEETFKYLYDFGDYWQHQIKVEKFLEKDNNLKYPEYKENAIWFGKKYDMEKFDREKSKITN